MNLGTPKKLSQETGGLNVLSLLREELSQEFKKNFQLCVRLKKFSLGTNNLALNAG
jgi:hypothetical protein